MTYQNSWRLHFITMHLCSLAHGSGRPYPSPSDLQPRILAHPSCRTQRLPSRRWLTRGRLVILGSRPTTCMSASGQLCRAVQEAGGRRRSCG